jgi:hypothetical protein
LRAFVPIREILVAPIQAFGARVHDCDHAGNHFSRFGKSHPQLICKCPNDEITNDHIKCFRDIAAARDDAYRFALFLMGDQADAEQAGKRTIQMRCRFNVVG